MRDDFGAKTVSSVAKRAGFRCSNPNCRQPTSGPSADPVGSVSIGVAAHITAASKNGPRYDSTLEKKHRISIKNAIWLCQSCSRLIDRDVDSYTTLLLQRWKESAENEAALAIKSGLRSDGERRTRVVAPTPFVAHVYSLLSTNQLVGRKSELATIEEWHNDSESAPILCINAVGGVGKSALAWTYFRNRTQTNTVGKMWWSFYDSRDGYESFVSQALAYATTLSLSEVQKLPVYEQEQQLLIELDKHPYLIVLDGIERLLLAYAQLQAPYLNESHFNPRDTNEAIRYRLSSILNKTTNSRAGTFLRKLAKSRSSKFIVTTRLLPSAWESPRGDPINGVQLLNLAGLSDEDAAAMWNEIVGNSDSLQLLHVLRESDNHPLMLQLLAHAVNRFHEQPGSIDAWISANGLAAKPRRPIAEIHELVVGAALANVDLDERCVLECLSVFRLPTDFESLRGVYEQCTNSQNRKKRIGDSLEILRTAGLLGWDRHAAKYDLHPIVRSFVYGLSNAARRNELNSALKSVITAHSRIGDLKVIDPQNLQDLENAIELFFAMLELGEFRQAYHLYLDLLRPYFFKDHTKVDLQLQIVASLFPDGVESRPPMSSGYVGSVYCDLALAYECCGLPEKASVFHEKASRAAANRGMRRSLCISLHNLSNTLLETGSIFESLATARIGVINSRYRDDSQYSFVPTDEFVETERLTNLALGQVLLATGDLENASTILARAERLTNNFPTLAGSYTLVEMLARVAFLKADDERLSALGSQLSHWNEEDCRRNGYAELVLAWAAMRQGRLVQAQSLLREAIQLTCQENQIDLELRCRLEMANLLVKMGLSKEAEDSLLEIWAPAQRGNYRKYLARAKCVLARTRMANNQCLAIDLATEAYRLAWCDGVPYVFNAELLEAKEILLELHEEPPELRPFDVSNYRSEYSNVGEIELDPEDELSESRITKTFEEFVIQSARWNATQKTDP